MAADPDKLMYSHHAAQPGVISYFDMSGQGDVIGQDATFTYKTIVRHMHVSHEQAAIRDSGTAGLYGAPVEGATLSDNDIIADFQRCIFVFIFQVLGNSAHYGTGKDLAVVANAGAVEDAYIIAYPAIVADNHIFFYDRKGADRNALSNFSIGVNKLQAIIVAHGISWVLKAKARRRGGETPYPVRFTSSG